MAEKTLITAAGNVISIGSCGDSDVLCHINTENNYVDHLIWELNTYKLHENYFTGKSNLVIIDVGANIGIFTLYAQDCASVIYAIEPHPTYYSILCKLATSYTNIVPVQKAIVNTTSANTTLYLNNENCTMHSTYIEYNDQITVNGISLSDFLTENNITHVDLIKIDIEGEELNLITSENVAQFYSIIDNWCVEAHQTGTTSLDDNYNALVAIFEGAGYTVTRESADGFIASK
jgi:FkbM family methyltransferase